MGVNISSLLISHELSLNDLAHKTVVVDAPNHLYQFLTTIRGRDGSVFTNSKGEVTSHLIGLFSRTANLMQRNIKLAYVFDGVVPKLKMQELEKRKAAKAKAHESFLKSVDQENVELMKKFAGRSSRLTREMIVEAKKLLELMGVPYVDAPSEAEAQASHMVKSGSAYAISSQDADSFVFGAPRLVRNLSISGKRKVAGKLAYINVFPQLLILEENLKELNLNSDQLIVLAMLVGTDYNPGGVPGIGPKKALTIARSSDFDKIFEQVKWSEHFNYSWREVFDQFKNIPVTDDYRLAWERPRREEIIDFLCKDHGFSVDRVTSSLDSISKSLNMQRGLGEFI